MKDLKELENKLNALIKERDSFKSLMAKSQIEVTQQRYKLNAAKRNVGKPVKEVKPLNSFTIADNMFTDEFIYRLTKEIFGIGRESELLKPITAEYREVLADTINNYFDGNMKQVLYLRVNNEYMYTKIEEMLGLYKNRANSLYQKSMKRLKHPKVVRNIEKLIIDVEARNQRREEFREEQLQEKLKQEQLEKDDATMEKINAYIKGIKSEPLFIKVYEDDVALFVVFEKDSLDSNKDTGISFDGFSALDEVYKIANIVSKKYNDLEVIGK